MLQIIRIDEDSVRLATDALTRAYHRPAAQAERLEELVGEPGFVLLVAVCDDDPVAYLHAGLLGRLDGGSMMLIYDMAVIPEQRRRGVGSALVSAAAEIARNSGAEKCWLVAEPGDTVARAFYESRGAEEFPAAGYGWNLAHPHPSD